MMHERYENRVWSVLSPPPGTVRDKPHNLTNALFAAPAAEETDLPFHVYYYHHCYCYFFFFFYCY
jgi:hypothetical protein